MDIQTILHNELKGSVDFFLHYTNMHPTSRGFGLTVDSTKTSHQASIASVGYALTAWVIATERGFIPCQEARDITCKTLQTLLRYVSHYCGFFAHFLHMETGERFRTCEFSTIDTALCLNGVITAAAYFHDQEIDELAQQLLERVDWNFLIFEADGRTLFRMAYNPDFDGDYVNGFPGFISSWSMAAEQKMMYLQAAGHVGPSTARALYQGFARDRGYYEGQPVIINPEGNLFAYQFSEAWLDTASYLDPDGIDWFNNTRLAALANRSYCIEKSNIFRTYHQDSWGLSCGDSPWGYDVSGSAPCLGAPRHNGTVNICGALASLPFIPDHTMSMIEHLYHNHPSSYGQYGFFDSYNLDYNPPWYSHSVYGINKGCSMIMIENYLSGLVWETYTNSPYIQNALQVLGFTKRKPASSPPIPMDAESFTPGISLDTTPSLPTQ